MSRPKYVSNCCGAKMEDWWYPIGYHKGNEPSTIECIKCHKPCKPAKEEK